MTKYAENTEVSAEKSVAEIQTTLKRYGAAKFAFSVEEERLIVGGEDKLPVGRRGWNVGP